MLFNSFIFLYAFLPITYFGFWSLKTKRQRYIGLTIASYIFYGYWNYKFCFLMAFSTLVSYLAGLGFLRWKDRRRRRWCLILPITVDLLLLAVFKYTNFALQSFQWVATKSHWPVSVPYFQILLPVGISFYTFHTISYIVDSYRGVVEPTDDFWEFACYVSLFSQLVAGPIVRFRQVKDDFEHIDRAQQHSSIDAGWSFFTLGLIKKVLIADTLAAFIDPAFLQAGSLSSAATWLCVLGYTYQLYFDFSGYSDMAVGLGHLFGIRLPQNFNSPYKAESMADFWRRWHISLSSCLRDYLYIPLGGNRGSELFMARNLLITMLIGGLWHGAQWTFIIWGAYHGALLVLERFGHKSWERLPSFFKASATFFLVMIGWVFFRSPTLSVALQILHKMFIPQKGLDLVATPTLVVLLGVAATICHGLPNTFEWRHFRWSRPMTAMLSVLFMVCLFAMYGAHASLFLYFQF